MRAATQRARRAEKVKKSEPKRKGRRLVDMDAAGEVYLPAPRVCERYGVTSMTLHRWLKDDEMGFPQPLYIRRFRYFRLSDLLAFEKAGVA